VIELGIAVTLMFAVDGHHKDPRLKLAHLVNPFAPFCRIPAGRFEIADG